MYSVGNGPPSSKNLFILLNLSMNMKEFRQYVACDRCGRGFKEETMLTMKRIDLDNKEGKEVKVCYECVMSIFCQD